MRTVGSRHTVAPLVALLTLSASSAHAGSDGIGGGSPEMASKQSAGASAPDSESAGSVSRRVVAEVMMGTGLATIGYLVGPKIGSPACGDCISAAGLAGASAAFPLGVYWGGRVVHGQGSFWLTIAAPWLVSAATAIALARDQNTDGHPALQIGTWGTAIAAPLSVVSYELSNAANRQNAFRESSGVRVAVTPWRSGLGITVGWRQ